MRNAAREELRPNLDQQIAEVRREIALRRNIFPRQVGKGALKQSQADYLMACMEGVLRTLSWLKGNRTDIEAWVAAGRPRAHASGGENGRVDDGA